MATTESIVINLISIIIVEIFFYIFLVKIVSTQYEKIRFQRTKEAFFKKLQNRIRYGNVKNLDDVSLIQTAIAKVKFTPFALADTYSLLVEYLNRVPDRDT